MGAALLTSGCGSQGTREPTAAPEPNGASPPSGARRPFVAQVWADNWFSLSVNGEEVGTDPVPITTERSFNATTLRFTATLPLTLAVVAEDFKQDDTGLEYIGTDGQQIGDGGFILQITDATTGKVVAGTSTSWRALVVHRAPLDKGCERSTDPASDCASRSIEEPAGWTTPGFDDDRWARATAYTPAQVGAREGFGTVRWSAGASLIWSTDLEADNTVLLRGRTPG